jgi:pyroglutamyl-peptidase
MSRKILLTSFDVWMPHHVSNTSDDLLAEMLGQKRLPENAYCLRKLPVDFEQAPIQVISEINRLQPDVIVCCGMAETREVLTVESNGCYEGETLKTAISVEQLVETLVATQVSHDAGQFVCNFLYYSILKYLIQNQMNSLCLFVHVPLLTPSNRTVILNDFAAILAGVADLKFLNIP